MKIIKKLKEFFKKYKKLSDISLIFLEIGIDGLILNFLVYCVFGLQFSWYSWIGWGFIPYILGEVVPRIFVKFKKRLV